ELVAEEDDAPTQLDVLVVDEAAARLGNVVAQASVVGVCAVELRVQRLLADDEVRAPRAVLADDAVEHRQARLQELDVLDGEVDLTAGGKPLPGLGRLAGPQDGDAVAH